MTKVEMGVQTTDPKVQKITKRGHDLEAVRKTTCLLKDAGFKVSYHMMPNLPGSSVQFDKKMVGELFENEDFQPDYLKIYPCVVMEGTKLSEMYKKGLYKSYDDRVLENVLFEELKSVPYWCRVDRVARDIPSDKIESGFRISNIRQNLEKRAKEEGVELREIRYREVRNDKIDPLDVKMKVRKYRASRGEEIFLSYESKNKIIALLRLRFPYKPYIGVLKSAALIREVHVYGKQVPIGKKGGNKQHSGWGSKLMEEAEKLSREAGFLKIAVIAGIGTREYYRKKGYSLKETYMAKGLR